jgi:hypothetical protein
MFESAHSLTVALLCNAGVQRTHWAESASNGEDASLYWWQKEVVLLLASTCVEQLRAM